MTGDAMEDRVTAVEYALADARLSNSELKDVIDAADPYHRSRAWAELFERAELLEVRLLALEYHAKRRWWTRLVWLVRG